VTVINGFILCRCDVLSLPTVAESSIRNLAMLSQTGCTQHHTQDRNAILSANLYYMYLLQDFVSIVIFKIAEINFTQGHWQ